MSEEDRTSLSSKISFLFGTVLAPTHYIKGLTAQQSDEEFNKKLDAAIASIYNASIS